MRSGLRDVVADSNDRLTQTQHLGVRVSRCKVGVTMVVGRVEIKQRHARSGGHKPALFFTALLPLTPRDRWLCPSINSCNQCEQPVDSFPGQVRRPRLRSAGLTRAARSAQLPAGVS